jgi:hypothetical protein
MCEYVCIRIYVFISIFISQRLEQT